MSCTSNHPQYRHNYHICTDSLGTQSSSIVYTFLQSCAKRPRIVQPNKAQVVEVGLEAAMVVVDSGWEAEDLEADLEEVVLKYSKFGSVVSFPYLYNDHQK